MRSVTHYIDTTRLEGAGVAAAVQQEMRKMVSSVVHEGEFPESPQWIITQISTHPDYPSVPHFGLLITAVWS